MDPERAERLDRLRDESGGWQGAAAASSDALAMIEVALLMAAADGRLDRGEADHIAETIGYLTGGEVSRDEVERIVTAYTEALLQEGWSARVARVAARLQDPDARRYAYRLAAAVALMDGWIHRDEAKLFSLLAKEFRMPPTEATALIQEIRACLGAIDESTSTYRV